MHFLDFNAHFGGYFVGHRIASEILGKATEHLLVLGDRLNHMHRDADRAGLVGQRTRNRLPDPPGGVGGEFIALGPVELLHGLKKPQIAFLDEVEQGQVAGAADVFLGDRDDETEVGAGEQILGFQIPFFNALRQLFFFARMDQRILSDFFQIHLYGVVSGIAIESLRILDLGIDIEQVAAFEHVDSRDRHLFIELVEEENVILDIGKHLQDLIVGDKAALLALGDEVIGFLFEQERFFLSGQEFR